MWPTHFTTTKSSIAELPFDNFGGDPKWERFADGLTKDIITDLARSRRLDVIARDSTEVYKGERADVRLIGQDLGVRYILGGSLQSDGDKIRVTAQLIDASTGAHIWQERYDRPATDLGPCGTRLLSTNLEITTRATMAASFLVDNEPGEGARFDVHFPLIEASTGKLIAAQ